MHLADKSANKSTPNSIKEQHKYQTVLQQNHPQTVEIMLFKLQLQLFRIFYNFAKYLSSYHYNIT